MTELKKQAEAILFAVGKKIHIAEIAKLCETQHLDDVKSALLDLQEDYKSRESPLMIFQEGDFWKLSVREKHLPLVHSLVSETELSKSLMETLAVIAWKYPILQSEVIHIRTNKAYDHLTELEDMGFISRVNYGRTKRIKLTEKFFTYFDLPSREEAQQAFRKVLPDELREKIARMEQEINDTEKAIDEAKRKKEAGGQKSQDLIEESPENTDDERVFDVNVSDLEDRADTDVVDMDYSVDESEEATLEPALIGYAGADVSETPDSGSDSSDKSDDFEKPVDSEDVIAAVDGGDNDDVSS